ncbi:dihydrolipoamide acetyltransferase family protein [Neorhizobium galegae]|uniref:Dihydrolipoamide acetyltransferase component of pyruvate dehydrogenase complex n=2 Tax=Neorhizobium galegae TaxID=399 RepID=A0A068ST51_NEOGA|nr:dihydrolipoamide acetyltransferase family protein [Neorhizobium galegae]KAB1087742.1 2-oxo acid dehydrogenase subunit E2 [Neorhizobium galegae]CDN49054.1 Branched-chain alpha-keto acid dehydrogenase subunit E2 [Neorhizobium galegae bv. orientalis str. HAMBI 540]CDZ50595.1 Branched-chain alpha-keto acid dehydrogenase subunit E2 [Neorhizobium galegae bv. orientalis]
MAEKLIKLPDVGEGVAEAELVEWHVNVGDLVREDMVLAAVMTGKATVEIPSPVDGEVTFRHGEIGDIIATGTVILKIRIAGEGADGGDSGEEPQLKPVVLTVAAAEPASEKKVEPLKPKAEIAASPPVARPLSHPVGAPRAEGEKPLAPPAVRLRAKEAGIDLRQVPGTGPAGRITHDDLDAFLNSQGGGGAVAAGLQPNKAVQEVKVVGLRRRIAEKMALSKSRIPHITYVEEIDMTALEELRTRMNGTQKPGRPKLTILPFLMRAMVKAIAEQPGINALYDDEAGIIRQYGGVHIGIAAQTPSGLVVPVVKHAEARDIFDCAREVARLSDAAKNGTALREELSGSTITISSLGAMGGIVSTPVINHPEVAIIGVNKLAVRPHWDGTQFVPRKMMNLSSSFDHRVIDGWDAATFVQRLKALMETPALIFVEE